MSDMMNSGRAKWGLAAVLFTLMLHLAGAGCGQLESSYPPGKIKETKLEVYVNNLTIPGAPKNTAYNWGEAEIIGYLQGTATHVAFYIPGVWGYPVASGYTFAIDPTTGAVTVAYSLSCTDVLWASTCVGADGWTYQQIDFMGHAKVPFQVGGNVGYWDILARPVVITANGTVSHKLEYETRARVLFSTDTYGFYQ